MNQEFAMRQAAEEAYAKKQEQISSIIEQAETALFEYGKTQEEITLARLAELDATNEQVAAYQKAAQELAKLQAAEEAREEAAKAAQKAEKERLKQIKDLTKDRDDLLKTIADRASQDIEVRFAEAIKVDSAESGRQSQLRAAEERRLREEDRREQAKLTKMDRQLVALETIATNTGDDAGLKIVGIGQ